MKKACVESCVTAQLIKSSEVKLAVCAERADEPNKREMEKIEAITSKSLDYIWYVQRAYIQGPKVSQVLSLTVHKKRERLKWASDGSGLHT